MFLSLVPWYSCLCKARTGLAVNLSFDATPPYSMRLLRVLVLVQMGEGLIQGTPAGAVAEPSQAGDELSPASVLAGTVGTV